jgi:hypothetical protein
LDGVDLTPLRSTMSITRYRVENRRFKQTKPFTIAIRWDLADPKAAVHDVLRAVLASVLQQAAISRDPAWRLAL